MDAVSNAQVKEPAGGVNAHVRRWLEGNKYDARALWSNIGHMLRYSINVRLKKYVSTNCDSHSYEIFV